jgi:hypothetical protein
MTTRSNLIKRLSDLEFYKKLPVRIFRFLTRLYHEKIFFKVATKESVFTSIWKSNYWADDESLSGPGSTLAYTETIRRELPLVFEKFGIKSVFDAPCGDFTWMKEVLKTTQVNYTGGDIVKGIVSQNQAYSNEHTKFVVFDITAMPFPKADLWICRDVFFHLSHKDIVASLQQFAASEIPYFLTTTHKNNGFSNTDIHTGDFRLIDLFAPPYNFPADVLYRFEDYIPPHPPREMCLFTRDQIGQVVSQLNPDFSA